MEQILVVDDHEEIARVLANSWLPALGYRAWAVHTYAAAQTTLAHNPFDLVLLDLQLPDTAGIEHVAAIRQRYPDVPVILITGHGSEQVAVDAFRLGIRNYLIKPFSFEQLQAAAEDALRERRLQRENAQLTRSLRQRIHELVVLSAIGRSVTHALQVDEVLARIVDAALYLTEAEEAFLLLRDTNQLVVRAARSVDTRTTLLNELVFDDAAERVIRERQSVRLAQGSPLQIRTNTWVQSALLVPLLAGTNVIGVLGVDNLMRTVPFTDEQERLLLALGDYAAIALENARLFAAKQRSETRYRDLFRNASDLLLVVNSEWRVVEVNAVVPRLLERSEDELVGQRLDQLVVPAQWPPLLRRLQHVLDHEQPLTAFEIELINRDGRRVPTELGARVFHDDHGQPLLVCALRDLTEPHLQSQIAHAEKLAAIERVVAGMAHELNNPLASIAGYSQLLLRDPSLSDTARDDIEHMLQQSRRAGQMVHNLLTIGQDLQLSYSPLDLSNLVASTLELPAAQPPVGVAVVRELSSTLPPVLGDPYQLQQVLVHLLNNAIRAMQPHGGTLYLRTCVADAAQLAMPQPSSPLLADLHGAVVVVEVGDTGSGIAPHQLSRIFDPFWTTKEVGDGPGLGLAVSRGIVARHGGQMWVHSVEGRGTTIFLALPVAQAADTATPLTTPATAYVVPDPATSGPPFPEHTLSA